MLVLCTAVLTALVAAVGQPGAALAQPSAADVEAQLDAAWNQLEPVIEHHNAIKIELNANRTKLDQLRKQLEPLQREVDVAFGRISSISAQRYISGGTSAFNALLTSGSPATLADQLSLLNQLARNEQGEIKDVLELKDRYERERKPLDELVTKLAAQEAELGAKQQTINADIKRLNEQRMRAYGSTSSTGNLRPAPCPVDYLPGPGGTAAKTACAQIGKWYSYGSGGPNTFDCSGLTSYAWRAAGVNLPHNARAQYGAVKRISEAELRPGDLIFFYGDIHHVGIAVGGEWMVHAPRSGAQLTMKRYKKDVQPMGYGRPGG